MNKTLILNNLQEFYGFKKESEFARFLEISSQTLSNWKARNTFDIDKLYTKCENINPEWLLSGEGNMVRENKYVTSEPHSYNSILSNAEPISDNTVEVLTNKNGNKFYIQEDDRIKIEVIKVPFPAYAGYLEAYEDENRLHEEFSTITFPVDHIGRGNYIAFEVKGDSMNGGGIDDTPDGADILCREIGRHLWTSGFRKTKYGCVLLTKTGIYHKDIIDYNENTGEITLESRNKECEPFKLNLNDIYKIFNVIKRYF